MNITSIFSDPGALTVGALWGVTVVGQYIFQSVRNNRQQSITDKGSATLQTSLQAAYNEQAKMMLQERDRGDRLALIVVENSTELGSLRAELKHTNKDNLELKEEVVRLTASVEALVIENRNKDKSISELVAFNRQVLKTIGAEMPESGEKENIHGNQS